MRKKNTGNNVTRKWQHDTEHVLNTSRTIKLSPIAHKKRISFWFLL